MEHWTLPPELDEDALKIVYRSRGPRGWFDLFASSTFTKGDSDAETWTRSNLTHVFGKSSDPEKLFTAHFNLRVQKNVAYLDYTKHKTENRNADADIGWLKIEFSDETRMIVESVSWKDEEDSKYVDLKPWTSWSDTPADPDVTFPQIGTKTLRPGQGRFRQLLLEGFHHKCCITGSPVLKVLEAAHIQRFAGGGNDMLGNGLLMRSDLHALFDDNLIGINPDSGTLSVQNSRRHNVKADGYYASLQGARVNLPRFVNREWLRERWDEFLAASSN